MAQQNLGDVFSRLHIILEEKKKKVEGGQEGEGGSGREGEREGEEWGGGGRERKQ